VGNALVAPTVFAASSAGQSHMLKRINAGGRVEVNASAHTIPFAEKAVPGEIALGNAW
jgi:hypothetical protein